jgi:hypothetical protein
VQDEAEQEARVEVCGQVAIPALSTGGPGSLVQLNEIPIPDSDPPATAAPGWNTEYAADTD